MALKRIRLGDYIELCDERNSDNKYTLENVKGISIQKNFIETKADMDGVNLTPYIVVKPHMFSYVTVTSRNGKKITLAYNDSKDTYIVSSSYIVFKIKDESLLIPEYLFMFFKRPEFDRYTRFNSWGSARETFDWDDMCDIELDLPPIEVQQKYVDIYNAMVENQKVYEEGLDDLKLACDAYIENLRKTTKSEEIGKYIKLTKILNTNEITSKCVGLYEHSFLSTPKISRSDIRKSQIISQDTIVYPPPHFGKIGSIGIYKENDKALVSPMYTCFIISDKNKLSPDYLIIWLLRNEFYRWADFMSCDSIRDTFDFDKLRNYSIPIPSFSIQQDIANIYNAYVERKEINEQLKKQIKYICPILIKGSIKESL